MYKLIIVDDEKYILEGLKNVINWNGLGFSVVGAFSDGEEALEYVSINNIDVVLSDIRMPKMDGITFITELRRRGNTEVEVVFLSGYSDFKYAQKAISLSACEYILKPSSPDTIIGVFNKVKKRLDQRSFASKSAVSSKINLNVSEDSRQAVLCRQIINYLEDNYMLPLTVQTIASEFIISPNYLGKIFYECTGRRVKDYLNDIRMEHATALLETGRYKIYEVAELVGFKNYDYFRKKIKDS